MFWSGTATPFSLRFGRQACIVMGRRLGQGRTVHPRECYGLFERFGGYASQRVHSRMVVRTPLDRAGSIVLSGHGGASAIYLRESKDSPHDKFDLCCGYAAAGSTV